MTRLTLIIPIVVALVAGWPGSADAKTTYYQCSSETYKLEEPWFGKAKFYLMQYGRLKFQPSEVDDDHIRFWYSEKSKQRRPENPSYYINRASGDMGYGRRCRTLDKPPS